jgi:hypothetical protein
MSDDELDQALKDRVIREDNSRIGWAILFVFNTAYLGTWFYLINVFGESFSVIDLFSIAAIPASLGFIYFTRIVILGNKVRSDYDRKGTYVTLAFLAVSAMYIGIVLLSALSMFG